MSRQNRFPRQERLFLSAVFYGMIAGMNGMKTNWKGHLLALFCVVIWGTTFVASKRLLGYYTPTQLMFMRFVVAYAVLWLLFPRWEKLVWREELSYLLMGLTGCTLYFWTENTALTLTYTANVSTIVSLAPLMTAILAQLTARDRHSLNRRIWLGSAAAFLGVVLVVFNGAFVLKLSPAGDLLALGTAVLWAVFCIQQSYALERRSSLFITRKVMFYGIVTSLPLMLFSGFRNFSLAPLLTSGVNGFCFLFLAVLGSALCYLAWAGAERVLGAVATSSYVYVIPFVTMAAGAVFLSEPISAAGILGAVLIAAGVWLTSTRQTKLQT